MLLSSTPWFSGILGKRGTPSPQTRVEIAVLGCLGLFRTT